MASRREQKEQLRREREARAAHEARARARRRRSTYVVIAVVVALVLLGAGILLFEDKGAFDANAKTVLPDGGTVPARKTTDLNTAARKAGCRLQRVKVSSRQHVRGFVKYSTAPPAGGNHFEIPADDGSYDKPPATERLVHALEHGRIVIWFKTGLPARDRANLRAYFEADSFQSLIAPDATHSPYVVAASGWERRPEPNGTGRLLGCKRMSGATFDALAAFRDEYRGNGPESVP